MNKTYKSSGLSCIAKNGDSIVYGDWNGGVWRIDKEKETKEANLPTPPLSIYMDNDESFIGSSEGEVWRVQKEQKTFLFKGKEVYYKDVSINGVIGLYKDKKYLIVIFIYGITLFNLETLSVYEEIEEEEIGSGFVRDGKVYYFVRREIKIYNIEEKVHESEVIVPEKTQVTKIICVGVGKQETLIYGTTSGKVSVTQLRTRSSYLFKAHKKDVEDEETFYPVTILAPVGESTIVTAGADGRVLLWDIYTQCKIKTLYNAKKPIIDGVVETKDCTVEELSLVTSEKVESLFSSDPCEKFSLSIIKLGK